VLHDVRQRAEGPSQALGSQSSRILTDQRVGGTPSRSRLATSCSSDTAVTGRRRSLKHTGAGRRGSDAGAPSRKAARLAPAQMPASCLSDQREAQGARRARRAVA